jgi:hypothetical protein
LRGEGEAFLEKLRQYNFSSERKDNA